MKHLFLILIILITSANVFAFEGLSDQEIYEQKTNGTRTIKNVFTRKKDIIGTDKLFRLKTSATYNMINNEVIVTFTAVFENKSASCTGTNTMRTRDAWLNHYDTIDITCYDLNGVFTFEDQLYY